MRLTLLALCLVSALPASAQWVQVDGFFGLSDLYLTNLVAADDAYVYATALAGQPVPNRFVILRSPDDGASWEQTFSGYNGGARGVFLGEIDGSMAALVTGGGEAGLLLSNDQGATWAETAARIPSSVVKSVARTGGMTVVVGSNPSYRSTDGGATWTTFGQGQPMGTVLAFGGAFYALNNIGQLHRLDGDAWTLINFGFPFATSIWTSGGQFWAKSTANAMYASGDGAAWSAQPTGEPTLWGTGLPAPDGSRPWFHVNAVFATDLFLSQDDGATLMSIGDGYPRDADGNACISNYAVTPRVVIGNAWACSATDLSQNGVFRYAFRTPRASGVSDPGFGLGGRAVVETAGSRGAAAIVPLAGASGFGGDDGAMALIGGNGEVARVSARGDVDQAYGPAGPGTVPEGVQRATGAARGPGGTVLVTGSAFANEAAYGVWRLNADGALDATYGTGGFALSGPFSFQFRTYRIASLPDGSALVTVVYRATKTAPASNAVVKLTPDGALDTSYGTSGIAEVRPESFLDMPLAIDAEGRAHVGFFGDGAYNVARLSASGALDATFGTGGVAPVALPAGGSFGTLHLALDASGRILIGGEQGGSSINTAVAMRLTASGAMDTSFGTDGVARAETPRAWQLGITGIAEGAEGTVVLGGYASAGDTDKDMMALRFTASGEHDTSWGTDGFAFADFGRVTDEADALYVDAAGRVIVAGSAGIALQRQMGVARFLSTPPVAEEPTPEAPEASGALTVAPNPTRGATSVRLALAAPEAHAHIAVYDALGREVAVLHDGPLASGEHAFRSPEALGTGVYIVRAMLETGRVTQRLTVVR